MPASAVTSVNSIAPDGRGGVGLGEGDAAATCSAAVFAAGAVGAACLHAESNRPTQIKRQYLRVIFVLEEFPAKAQRRKEILKSLFAPLRLCGKLLCSSQ